MLVGRGAQYDGCAGGDGALQLGELDDSVGGDMVDGVGLEALGQLDGEVDVEAGDACRVEGDGGGGAGL